MAKTTVNGIATVAAIILLAARTCAFANEGAPKTPEEAIGEFGGKIVQCNVRLMQNLRDASQIPQEGTNLIIVASVKGKLYLRTFNDVGVCSSTDELTVMKGVLPFWMAYFEELRNASYPKEKSQFDSLRNELTILWSSPGLTQNQKDQVIGCVTRFLRNPYPKTVIFTNSILTDIDFLNLLDDLIKINPVRIDLRFTKIEGHGFEALDKISNLSDLDLSSTLVFDQGLQSLGKLDHLKHLSLNHTFLSLSGLQHFVTLSKMRETYLYLSGATVVDRKLDPCPIGCHFRLEKVGMPQLLSTLKDLLLLKGLDLSDNGIKDGDLNSLVKDEFGQLEYLVLSDNSLTDKGLAGIGGLDTLRVLSLANNKNVTDNAITTDSVNQPDSALKNLTNLTGLSLAGTRITDFGLSQMKFAHLQQLDISNTRTRLERKFLVVLALLDAPNMIQLNVAKTGLSKSGLIEIGKLESLQFLNLSETDVRNEWIETYLAHTGIWNPDLLVIDGTKATAVARIRLVTRASKPRDQEAIPVKGLTLPPNSFQGRQRP